MKISINIFFRLFLVLLFSTVQNSFAQNLSDTEGWSSIEVGLNISKKLSFSVSEHLRYRNKISTMSNYFTQLETSYELLKDFNLGGGVRFIRENDDVGNIQGLETHFRYQFEINYKHDLKMLTLFYRLRYQHKNEIGLPEEEVNIPNEYIRFRMGLGYKLDDPAIGLRLKGELFNQIQKENLENGFNRYRLTFDTYKKFKNFGKVTLFYGFQKNFNRIELKQKSIIGIKYKYSFDLY
ncbi:MAG: DUF2490 domain-containing protein [Flavobacteriaceae bacterium]